MTSKRDRAIVVSALKHAAPYIRLFKGKVFVIKAGGEVFADPAQASALIEQVGILHQVGSRPGWPPNSASKRSSSRVAASPTASRSMSQ